MVELRRLRTDDESIQSIISGVNRIIDALLGNTGGRIALLDDDGVLLDIIGGASLGTSEPSLKIRSAIGEHVLVQHSAGVITLLEVTDAGVVIYALTLTGNLHVGGDFDVDGNVALGNSITDTTLVAGPLTANATINVKGNTTLGDAITDTTSIAGPATLDSTLNVKGSTTLGDAEADTVTIVDWIVKVTSNDLLFTDDGGGTVVKIGDQSSTYQLDVAIGDFHVADDAVIDGDISAGRGVFGGTTFSGSEELRVVGQSLLGGDVTMPSGTLLLSSGNVDVQGGTAGQLRVGGVIVNATSFDGSEEFLVNGNSRLKGPVVITTGDLSVNGTNNVFTFNGTTQTQTTVGAAGGASAQPATPRWYLKVTVGANSGVIPVHNA